MLPPVLVVELGDRIAAGACGSLLASLGADVVLVEQPRPLNSHKWCNRPAAAAGKRSIVVDRTSAQGKREIQTLVEKADVVLLSSDLSPVDIDFWKASRPRTQIVCDITAFGHDSPLSGLALSESLVQAYSAVADTMGHPKSPPALIGAPVLDMETAAFAASAIVAALRVRRRHGLGQRIDMALFDVAVNALLTFIPLYHVGRPASRNGNRHPTLAPWNAYRAKDGWVLVCGPTNDQWKRICQAMESPQWTSDPRFASPSKRLENVDEIDHIVGSWVVTLTVDQCVTRLTQFLIPSGPIVPIEGLAVEANLSHRGMIQVLRDPVSAKMVHVPALPIREHGLAPSVQVIPAPDADRGGILELASSKPVSAERVSGDIECSARALEGVRVIEIGMNTVAPLACRQLGALGADVIKVEPPTGDSNRINAPLREDGEAYVFALSNTDKRGIVLNLREESDKQILFRLLASADMVIENLKPGSLDKLGVGAKDVLRRFPSLIYCSVNGFGHDSVYPGRPALDTVIQGMSGVMSASPVNGVPTKAGISVSDQLGGQLGMLAMLAALDRKERTGLGAHFDIAMQDCSAWSTQYLWNDPQRSLSASIIAAVDGYVAVEGDVSRFPLRTLTREAAVNLLTESGIAAAPVLSVGEVLEHSQVKARGLFVERPTADGSRWMVLGSPMRLKSTPAEIRSAMPRLGVLDPGLASELNLTVASCQT